MYSYSLRSVTIPYGVISIGYSAFAENSIEEVHISSSVRSIGESAFFYNIYLREVTIDDGVESIGAGAFSENLLSSIVIPASVKSIGELAFDTWSLNTFVYLGTEDIALNNLFHEQGSSLTSVCVPPDYKSDYFAEAYVTRNSTVCEPFERAFNHCYEGKYIDGEFRQIMRKNATDYENQTNECMEYHCFNESGRVPWSKCNSTKSDGNMCVDQKCVKSDYYVKKWAVVLEFNERKVKAEDVDVVTVAVDISNMTGIDIDVMVVGAEYDDDGYAIDVVVYVDEEDMAISIRDEVNAMDKGEGCRYGVLCMTKKAKIRVSELDLSPSTSFHNTLMAFLIALPIFWRLH